MPRRPPFPVPLSVALAAALLTTLPPALAGPRDGYWLSVRERGNSLDEVVSGLRDRRAGKVLSADTVQEDGRPVHRIRILNDEGRVRGLRFDGDTGRPLPRPEGGSRRYPR